MQPQHSGLTRPNKTRASQYCTLLTLPVQPLAHGPEYNSALLLEPFSSNLFLGSMNILCTAVRFSLAARLRNYLLQELAPDAHFKFLFYKEDTLTTMCFREGPSIKSLDWIRVILHNLALHPPIGQIPLGLHNFICSTQRDSNTNQNETPAHKKQSKTLAHKKQSG